MSFEEFIELVKGNVRSVVGSFDSPDDDLLPALFMYGSKPHEEKSLLLCVIDPRYLENKDTLGDIVLPSLIMGSEAEHFAFVSSAWMSSVKPDDLEGLSMRVRPYEDPDRDEIVSIGAGSGNGDYVLDCAPLYRPDDQAPSLGDWGFSMFPFSGNILIGDRDKEMAEGRLLTPLLAACVLVNELENAS